MDISHKESLLHLRRLYKDAFHIHHEPADADVLRWADDPELWAEHKIRHSNWSWSACEATLRHCRTYRRRARLAYEAAAALADGSDASDPLMPLPGTGHGTGEGQ